MANTKPDQSSKQTPTQPGTITPNKAPPTPNHGNTGPVPTVLPPVRKEVDRPGMPDQTPNTSPVPEVHVPGPGAGGQGRIGGDRTGH